MLGVATPSVCMTFQTTGQCERGSNCPYIHDTQQQGQQQQMLLQNLALQQMIEQGAGQAGASSQRISRADEDDVEYGRIPF